MSMAFWLARGCGLTLRQAADEVREHGPGWLDLLTRVEQWGERDQGDPMLGVGIVWLSFEEGQKQRRYRVMLGKLHEIAAASTGAYTLGFVSIARARTALYANAKDAGITLPKRLTVDPRNKRAHEDWQRQIRAYQAAAGARIARALLKA